MLKQQLSLLSPSLRWFLYLSAPWVGAQLWERLSPRAPFAVSTAAIFVSALPARFKLKRVGGEAT